MQTVHHRSRLRLGAILSVAVIVTAACGDATGSASRPTLVARDASVATHEVATAVVRGTTLNAASYSGVLGATPITAERVNDSTVALLVPSVPAGPHLLKLNIGNVAVEAMLQVTVTADVVNPDAYIAVVNSAIAAEMTALDSSLALAASRPISIDLAAFAQDRAVAQASLDSARVAYAALTVADRQEVANILRATYGIEVGAATARLSRRFAFGSGPSYCRDRDLPLTDAEAQECSDAAAADLRTYEEDAVYCQAAAFNASLRSRREVIRTFLRHLVNGCHYSRLAHWSLSTWAVIQWPTMPNIDLFGQFDPDASADVSDSPTAPNLAVAATPLVFQGIDFFSFPVRMQFRPMIAADVGKVVAATRLAGLLSDAADSWHELNSSLARRLGKAPPTLAQVTSAPLRVMAHTPDRVRLGAVQPQAIRWFWQRTATGLNLKFDADDRSRPIPFTFDVIYDAGSYGADTIRIPAVLAIDSTRIYQSAILGRWAMEHLVAGGTRPVDFRSEIFRWGPRVDIMTAAIINPLQSNGECLASSYKVGTTCEYYFSWKVYFSSGRYYMEVGHLLSGTVTTTPLALPLTTFTVFQDGRATLRFTK